MRIGDPVALACKPEWTGVIEKVRRDGLFDVTLDDGGKAKGMARDDLIDEQPEEYDRESEVREEAARERRATADKSWPPKTIETKVPNQTGQK